VYSSPVNLGIAVFVSPRNAGNSWPGQCVVSKKGCVICGGKALNSLTEPLCILQGRIYTGGRS